MIISVMSPHSGNNGNTVTSILVALGLADLKKPVLLTHTSPKSVAFEHYLGVKNLGDKTTTPKQLVKLLGLGAIQTTEIGDYCKREDDFLDVFINTADNFTEDDMLAFLQFVIQSDTNYVDMVFDIDSTTDTPTTRYVLENSDIVILNINANIVEIQKFKAMEERVMRLCKGKKVLVVCSDYDPKVVPLKGVEETLGLRTSVYHMRRNVNIMKYSNTGQLVSVYQAGRRKNVEAFSVFKDVKAIVVALTKLKVQLTKQRAQRG